MADEEEIKKHLKTRELDLRADGYFCKTCNVPLVQHPMSHIKGNQHKTKLFLEMIEDKTRYPSLFAELPANVKEAHSKNFIKRDQLNFKCTLCNIILSGKEPLLAHLNSKAHRNKVTVFEINQISPKNEKPVETQFPKTPPDSQDSCSSPTMDRFNKYNGEKGPQQTPIANESTTNPYNHENAYKNEGGQSEVRKPTLSIPRADQDKNPLRIYIPRIGNNRHDMKLNQNYLVTANNTSPTTTTKSGCEKTENIEYDNPLQQDTRTAGQHNDGSDNSLIMQAMKMKHISKNGDSLNESYRCEVCVTDVTGPVSLVQHLKGTKHAKKLQLSLSRDQRQNQQALPAQPYPQVVTTPTYQRDNEMQGMGLYSLPSTVPTVSDQNITLPRNMIVSISYNANAMPPYNQQLNAAGISSNTLGELVNDEFGTSFGAMSLLRHTQDFFPQEENVFQEEEITGNISNQLVSSGARKPTRCSKQGLVCVFNNYMFDEASKWYREGAQLDNKNLFNAFTNLQYQVELYPNFSREETLSQLTNVVQNINGVDRLLMFFLSHGKSANEFFTTDMKSIDISEILDNLTDSRCPSMKDKPKLVFFNYCRGENIQASMLFDTVKQGVQEAPKNLAVVQATLPGMMANRLPDKGTIFVDSLCEILEQYAEREALNNIVYKTSKTMQQKMGTTASVQLIDFPHPEEFYFDLNR